MCFSNSIILNLQARDRKDIERETQLKIPSMSWWDESSTQNNFKTDL